MSKTVATLTKMGKFLRKLRIEKSEYMQDMAKRLGVTTSYISAVEHGKRKMPKEWVQLIESSYELTSNEKMELTLIYIVTNLTSKELSVLELAVAAISKLESFTKEELEYKTIMAIIGREIMSNDQFQMDALVKIMM
ncbi:helix-turn-helix domain-containing protein [Lysinibacillus sphaericus]|uniref:helix-turn-helix domain-containing protein n=1 Tax=Lysinibacillus sphaericus TaxID=1421 RepID=UPI001F509311|nr:helix-turn-helix transcriptional regulator [Lysinibacillus sphaericus]